LTDTVEDGIRFLSDLLGAGETHDLVAIVPDDDGPAKARGRSFNAEAGEAEANNLEWRTVQNAKTDVGIASRRHGQAWIWTFPDNS